MSKKTKPNDEAQPKLESYIIELLNKRTAVFSASTREELVCMVEKIPTGVRYSAGPIGQSFETDSFTIRIDILK